MSTDSLPTIFELKRFYRESNPPTNLDDVFNHMPPDPLAWGDKISEIGYLAYHAQDRTTFATQLIDRVFSQTNENNGAILRILFPHDYETTDKVGAERSELRLMSNRIVFFNYLHNILKIATATDRQFAQAAIARRLISKSDFDFYIADIFSGFPEMRVGDVDIVTSDDVQEINYWGVKVKIKPPIPGAIKAREVGAGLAVLMLDKDDQPLNLVFLGLRETKSEETMGSVCTCEEFFENHYYGEPVTLAEINESVVDKDFEADLSRMLNESQNLVGLPICAKARLRLVLQDPATADLARELIRDYQISALELFQILKGEDLIKTLEYINDLKKRGFEDVVYLIIKGAAFVSEFSVGMTGEERTRDFKLLEKKVISQLLEVVNIDPSKIQESDLFIIAISQLSLIAITQAAKAMKSGGSIPLLTEQLQIPTEFLSNILAFSERFPHAKTLFQTAFDLMTAINIAKQRQAPYAGKVAEMKAHFYEDYNRHNVMGKEVVTTSNIDVDRASSLVIKEFAEGRLPNKPRLLLVGCGNCQRFEKPFMKKCQAAGVEFGEVLGVDINDRLAEIPADLNIRFRQGDVKDKAFLKEEEKFDIIAIPWSMINDLVEKEGLIAALQQFRALMTEKGIMILDFPLPIGANSYFDIIEQQRELWGIWGIMERDFKHEGQQLRSLFDIMHLREIFMHLVHAQLLPTSPFFPLEFNEQQALCVQLALDDSILTSNNERGLDLDAYTYPIWQAQGAEKYNRVTIACRAVSEEEIERQVGLSPSVLVSLAFTS